MPITRNSMDKKIGFIGQGWIGRNYADDFEARGYDVVRYALEEPYAGNKDKLADRGIVFIAVPTPTTPEGFDFSPVRDALSSVPKGATAVIKSTMLPGTTDALHAEFPGIFVMHSPEFLSEATAAHDAANPKRNIVGVPEDTEEYRARAREVLGVLPKAPYELVCGAKEAEFIKYGRNALGYVRVVFINSFYDAVRKTGADWEVVRDAMAFDPDNGPTYMNPVHKTGRGAGGHCFIKDFAAFADFFERTVGDPAGMEMIRAIERKNKELLKSTNKDLDLLKGVYGEE